MIIAVFSAVQLYCFAYAIAMFCTKASCQYPSNSVALGFFIWTLTHTLQYLVWVYPVMYILWPRALQAYIEKKCKCCAGKSQKQEGSVLQSRGGQDYHYDDFDHVDGDSDDGNENTRRLDGERDEWIRNQGKSNTHEVYFLGTQRVEQEIEPKSELVRRSMKIVKNRASSTINDRADSLLNHQNTALNERSLSRRGLINGSLVENESMHMEERRSGNVAADSYAHLVETPYGGKAVAFDDNDDQSFISDRSRDKSVDNILGSDSPESSRRASEAGDGDDLRLS